MGEWRRPFDRKPLRMPDRIAYVIATIASLAIGIWLNNAYGTLQSLPWFITCAGMLLMSILPIKGAYSEDLSANVALFGAMIPGLSQIYLGRYKTALVWITWFTLMATIFAMILNKADTEMVLLINIALTGFTWFANMIDTDRIVDELRLNMEDLMMTSTQLANPMMGIWIVNASGAALCIIIVIWERSIGNADDETSLILASLFATASVICVAAAIYSKRHWKGERREAVTISLGNEEIIGNKNILRTFMVDSAMVTHPLITFAATIIAITIMNGDENIRLLFFVALALYMIPFMCIIKTGWDEKKTSIALIITAVIDEAAIILLAVMV